MTDIVGDEKPRKRRRKMSKSERLLAETFLIGGMMAILTRGLLPIALQGPPLKPSKKKTRNPAARKGKR
jgi:hypothetical protein